jgi:choline kinase
MKGRGQESEGEAHSAHFSLDRPAVRYRRVITAPRAASAELPQRARAPADLLRLLPSTAASLSPSSGNKGAANGAPGVTGARLPAPAIATTTIDGIVAAAAASGDPLAETRTAPPSDEPTVDTDGPERGKGSAPSGRRGRRLTYHDLMRWIQKEAGRRAAGKARRHAARLAASAGGHLETETFPAKDDERQIPRKSTDGAPSERRGSDAGSEGSDSDGSAALDMLREMLERQAAAVRGRRSSLSLKSLRGKHRRRHSTAPSSDTDFYDSDVFVPSCDATLDNSQTLPLGAVREPDERPGTTVRTASATQREAWRAFKFEVVRLAHTLKLRGWRRVPLDRSGDVDIVRLSGALTNAVYVVTPPASPAAAAPDGGKARPPPRKLLLRIYGSQVDHLIDRAAELQILRRLARRRIGPRLLGTFANGRFEEFLNARALRAEDLHVPDVSRQIAKRMRELHDGIDLTREEVAAGPFVWRNIDRWLPRAEMIIEWIEAGGNAAAAGTGYVVGSPFKLFKEALARYRAWLLGLYEGEEEIRERLIFAHNDVRPTALWERKLTADRRNTETFSA